MIDYYLQGKFDVLVKQGILTEEEISNIKNWQLNSVELDQIKSTKRILSEDQITWLKQAVDIGRGDYSEAKSVQDWVYRILNGEDVSKELAEYD